MKNYKQIAEEKMAKQNHVHALFYLVYIVLLSIASGATFGAAFLVVVGPLEFGYSKFLIEVSDGKVGKIENIMAGFYDFIKSFVLGLLKFCFLFLWTMLFFIPGIIKALAYSMSYFVLIDNPGIDANSAITKSREIMDGHKLELCLLYLSFILKILLCVITVGIYSFWLIPTMQLAKYELYLDLTEKKVKEPKVIEGTIL